MFFIVPTQATATKEFCEDKIQNISDKLSDVSLIINKMIGLNF